MSKTATAEKDNVVDKSAEFSKGQLKAFVERIELLDSERKGIADDIRDIFAEAKGNCFDVAALRTIIRLRKQAIVETYMNALGMN